MSQVTLTQKEIVEDLEKAHALAERLGAPPGVDVAPLRELFHDLRRSRELLHDAAATLDDLVESEVSANHRNSYVAATARSMLKRLRGQ